MNKLIISLIFVSVLYSCKNKKPKDSPFFPVISYLQAQVKIIDTSSYRIIKIETTDSISDTIQIKKEEFKNYAKDFTNIPDINDDDKKEKYDSSNTYDDVLNNVLLTYTAKNPNEEIQRETIMLEPDASGNSNVKTIIIDKIKTSKDSTIVKNMLWQINRRFQIVTKAQLSNLPEKIKTLQVQWQ